MPALQNPRRERFAQEFVKDLNQTKAAARAGYRHPGVKGSQLMAIPVVSARISELQAAVAQRNEISVDSIAAQLDEDRALAYRAGFYDVVNLDAWLASHRRRSTSEEASS